MTPDPREKIKALLLQQRMSERRLAEIAEIDQSALNRYMRHVSKDIQLNTLGAIAAALGTTIGHLLGEDRLSSDPKIMRVLQAMEAMPEYKKDAVVATSSALAQRDQDSNAA